MASNGGDETEGTATRAMRRMAESEPELAARMMLQSMPVAAATLPEGLNYRLELSDLGAWRISSNGDYAEIQEIDPDSAESSGDAFAIMTDSRTLALIASGASPLPAMLNGRLKLRGKRRKALSLRRLSQDAGPRDVAKAGLPVDPDLLFRSLAYAIEPEWTRGHRFRIGYELVGEGGGSWTIVVDDGAVSTERGLDDEPESLVRIRYEDWLKLLSGETSPTDSARLGWTELRGAVPPVTLLGRWIDRAEGVDGPELEREQRQRRMQARHAGSWGSRVSGNGAGTSADAGDPGATAARPKGGLMDHQQLYALWERQNWRAHELDFSEDKQHWLETPAESQMETAFSFGSFYVGEERVTADLAPFVLAAPNGEVEAFLATQLVDEMRHAVFFDRWMAEVMALEADDLRSRLQLIEKQLQALGPWSFLFDDSLREIANRIKDKPDDLKLFVEGIVTYHMVTEGVLAMPGQRLIIQYTEDHKIYPGFNKGFRLVEQDEHRHIAFGVRFLRDVCEERPEMKQVIVNKLCELLPEAAKVFAPPKETDPTDYWSYDHHSSQVYGFAYQALNRRMKAIGIEIPGPEELMPGPCDFSGLDQRSRIDAERTQPA